MTSGKERANAVRRLFLFHGALQRVLVAPGKIHHLCHLGFGDLMGKDPHDSQTFLMHGQHDLEGLRVGHSEETFQHMHDKFHRRVVVIQQHDLVKRRALRLGLGFKNHITLGPAAGGVGGIAGQSGGKDEGLPGHCARLTVLVRS